MLRTGAVSGRHLGQGRARRPCHRSASPIRELQRGKAAVGLTSGDPPATPLEQWHISLQLTSEASAEHCPVTARFFLAPDTLIRLAHHTLAY